MKDPHHLLEDTDAATVGELSVHAPDNRQVFRCPPDWSEDEIREELDKRKQPEGRYYVYGLHFSTRKQIAGYHAFEFTPREKPQPSAPEDGVVGRMLAQQHALVERLLSELREQRAALEQREREFEARVARWDSEHHQAEVKVIEQRHALQLDHTSALWSHQQRLEAAYQERIARLDAQREELDLERQRLHNQTTAERRQLQQEAHERELAAIERAAADKLKAFEQRLEAGQKAADPFAMLEVIGRHNPKALTRWVEHAMPKAENDQPNEIERYVAMLEPLTRLLAGLRPPGSPPIAHATATAASSSPATVHTSEGETFRG